MDYASLFSVLVLALVIVSAVITYKLIKHKVKPSDANYLELKEGDVIVIDDKKIIKYRPAGNALFAVEIQDKEEAEPIVVTKGKQRGIVDLN